MSQVDRKPYIAVTGITLSKEASAIGKEYAETFTSDASHLGMAGYLVSDETLRGGAPTRSRYPRFADLPNLLKLSTNSATINMIHYRTSDRNTPLADQVSRLFNSGNIYADNLSRAIQFNTGRIPHTDQLDQVKRRFPDLQIVIALNRGVLSRHDPRQWNTNLYERLRQYGNLVDFLLIDSSGGRGIEFSVGEVKTPYESIKRAGLEQPVILAGGFDAANATPRLTTLTRELGTKNFGIDAEGGLRTPRHDDRTSRLDLPATLTYIRNSAGILVRQSSVS